MLGEAFLRHMSGGILSHTMHEARRTHMALRHECADLSGA